MFQMYLVICAVSMLECNKMYEHPHRLFDTKDQCLYASIEKEINTRFFFIDENGYFTLQHLEVGCEPV